MRTLSLELRLKNIFRFVKAEFISWGVLSTIYSISAAVLLEPVFEKTLNLRIPGVVVWFGVMVLILVPGLFERFLSQDIALFSGPPRRLRNPFQVYFLHEMRRLPTWLGFFATIGGVVLAWMTYPPLCILAFQFGVQRALFSVSRWRTFASQLGPGFRTKDWMTWFTISHLGLSGLSVLTLTVIWVSYPSLSKPIPIFEFFLYANAFFVSTLVGCAVVLEGDSGRPWMVNLISMTAAVLAGFLTIYSLWFWVVALYFWTLLRAQSQRRFQSVENFYEDTLIS